MLVDLGGGTLPHPRADVVIDLHHPRKAPAQNAGETPWVVHSPYNDINGHLADASADEVYSSHFMEHIHRGQPLINVMNEAWRVLKPGGTYTMIMPLVGFTNPVEGMLGKPWGAPCSDQIGWQPWADPTHVNYWWFPEALKYFTPEFGAHADYGIKMWSAVGGYIDQAEATRRIDRHKRSKVDYGSWWSVRDTWEGVAVLVK